MNESKETNLSSIDQQNQKLVHEAINTQEEYDYIYAHPDEFEEDDMGDSEAMEPERSADAGVAASQARVALKEFYDQNKDTLHELALKEDETK